MTSNKIIRSIAALVGLACSLAAAIASANADPVEKSEVTVAIGGTSAQFYFLPVVIADRLGYFKKEGLTVTFVDTGSGAKALQALVSGGAEVAAGSFEHPLRMQARGRDVVAFVKFGRFHGNVLGIVPKHAKDYKSPADMKGWVVGVSAPGSSSYLFVTLLLAKQGLKAEDVSFIALGQGAGGVAAVRTGKGLDALCLTDPTISELESSKDIVVVSDSRTLKGTIEAYGGDTISGVFYANADFMKKNPQTIQALATGIVRALAWMKTASLSDIMSKVPDSIIGGRPDFYKSVLEKNIENFQHDGTFSEDAVATTVNFMRKTDDEIRESKFDPAKAYINTYAKKANELIGAERSR
ncbi:MULTISPECIES: ABC transporter substrate-binding protein [Xanthobacter]|uniref:ABC transporter substrate-binding protein n=1 Tax=Xanthobacter TaxID=279 RepID=UPI00372A023D